MIFYFLKKIIFLNYINYLLFKNLISFLISFIICFILIKKYIYVLNKYNIIQKSKNINCILDKNTPTMGGIFIIISIIISMILCNNIKNNYFYIIIISIVSYGGLGFIDDYIKISKKFNINGIPIKYKYIFQTIFSIIISYFIYKESLIENKEFIKIIFIPFIGNKLIINNIFIFFIISYFTIMGSCNSVNLSDGIDGLSIKIIISILSFFIVTEYLKLNEYILSYDTYLEIINLCFIVIGSGLSFLWFNSYPSKIFMGDTGSLSLGSLLGTISIILKKEFLLIIIGGILIIETLSVIIQIISIIFFNKKVFLMAPLHHHYQIKGIHESKIVTKFLIISIILNFIGIFSLIK